MSLRCMLTAFLILSPHTLAENPRTAAGDGSTVEVLVTDPDGTPLENALISPVCGPERDPPASCNPVRTDEFGRSVLVGLIPGKRFLLEVSRQGFGTEDVHWVVGKDEELQTIILKPSARIAGRVLDGRGRPIAGVYIVSGPARHSDATAFTDHRGRFFLEVHPDTSELRALRRGFQHFTLRGLAVSPGEELQGIEIVLDDAAAVSGTVSFSDGRPAANASLSFKSLEPIRDGNTGIVRARAFPDGRYQIPWAPVGDVEIVARVGARRSKRIAALEAGKHRIDLVIPLGLEVVGRVIDTGGEPLPDAILQLISAAGPGSTESLTTGLDGTVRFSHVGEGEYRVEATKNGYAMIEIPPLAVADTGTPEFEIVMRRNRVLVLGSARLSGVVTEGGTRMAGVKVRLLAEKYDNLAYTDSDGRFEFRQLVGTGTYRLTVFSPSHEVLHEEDIEMAGHRDIVVEVGADSDPF